MLFLAFSLQHMCPCVRMSMSTKYCYCIVFGTYLLLAFNYVRLYNEFKKCRRYKTKNNSCVIINYTLYLMNQNKNNSLHAMTISYTSYIPLTRYNELNRSTYIPVYNSLWFSYLKMKVFFLLELLHIYLKFHCLFLL